MRIFIYPFIICLLIAGADAQPKLDIRPHTIEFEDMFNRLEKVYLINEGDEPLVIYNITYGQDIYFIRFNGYARYPFTIQPDDTVTLDCILAGYLHVASSDTVDTMYVYNNGVKPIDDAKIKIDFFDDDFRFGNMNGYVTDGISGIANAVVYFYYQGTFIIDTAHTTQNGYYSKDLPPGNYLAAAEKTSYYVSFYDSLYDPFTAKSIRVAADSVSNADIKLTGMISTPISVTGNIYDSLGGTFLKKGSLIVRKGTHNPTRPLSGNNQELPTDVYTTFIRDDGTYTLNNITEEDYYIIQAFSDYFLPSFYIEGGSYPVFWQQADSILLNGSHSNINITMPRDSSIGGGIVNGNILFGDATSFSDVLIYVQSTANNLIYSYGMSEETGEFQLSFLPYGNYKLLGQKLGINDGHSAEFTIDPLNTSISGITLIFDPLSADDFPILPNDVQLYQNYPNPFNPSTTVEFYLPSETYIRLAVYNLLGEEVSLLRESSLREGRYSVNFDASNLPSGAYFISLQTKSGMLTRKVLLLK